MGLFNYQSQANHKLSETQCGICVLHTHFHGEESPPETSHGEPKTENPRAPVTASGSIVSAHFETKVLSPREFHKRTWGKLAQFEKVGNASSVDALGEP